MKDRTIQAIDITLKPSLLLMGALTLISMLSCLVLLLLPIPFLIKLLMMAIVIFLCVYYTLRDALQLLPRSWHRVEVTSLGQLRLTNKQGQQFTPDLSASSFIHPLLIILNASKRALPPVLYFQTAEGRQQHRQLRVWLRWWQHETF